MRFLSLAKERYSHRSYTEEPVEQEKLDAILEAGRVAPTGANRQPQRLIVVQQAKGLQKIAKAANLYGAPCAIIVCGDTTKAWTRAFDGKNLTDIDTAIVTTHMMLEATELALGTLWVCAFRPDIIREEFSLPDNLQPIHILALGYSQEKPQSPDRHASTRKPLCETVFFETL